MGFARAAREAILFSNCCVPRPCFFRLVLLWKIAAREERDDGSAGRRRYTPISYAVGGADDDGGGADDGGGGVMEHVVEKMATDPA